MDLDDSVVAVPGPGGRPLFPCPNCKKQFTLKGNLKRHLLTHAGVRPFECPDCGKVWRWSVVWQAWFRKWFGRAS